jgi:hypothetical protein
MQPFIQDDNGRIRFKKNALVRILLDEASKIGFDMNSLCAVAEDENVSQADWEQFYQLIGYSLAGYHELSNVSDASALDATIEARKTFPNCGGCRNEHCEIHSGVDKETP